MHRLLLLRSTDPLGIGRTTQLIRNRETLSELISNWSTFPALPLFVTPRTQVRPSTPVERQFRRLGDKSVHCSFAPLTLADVGGFGTIFRESLPRSSTNDSSSRNFFSRAASACEVSACNAVLAAAFSFSFATIAACRACSMSAAPASAAAADRRVSSRRGAMLASWVRKLSIRSCEDGVRRKDRKLVRTAHYQEFLLYAYCRLRIDA